jgi:23S rRNA pseudouridine2605 synthase
LNVRLNKLLAERGIGARRKCDALIERGEVRVNGEVVTALGTRVDPQRDRVTVGGRPLPGAARPRYLVLHKPVGVITTLSDPEGRPTIARFMPAGVRLFPVGRLDADTSGLLLLTNDGEMAHHLMHPRYGVEKFYRVLVARRPEPAQVARLQRGVMFEPGMRSAPARVRVREPIARGHVLELAIHEGRYRQVRRMCEAVGLEVLALHRWGYGPLRLGELARGMVRELSGEELARLRAAAARPGGGAARGVDRPARAQRSRLLSGGTGFAAVRRRLPGEPPAGEAPGRSRDTDRPPARRGASAPGRVERHPASRASRPGVGPATRRDGRGRPLEGRRERGIAPRGESRGRPLEGRRERGIAPRGEWRGRRPEGRRERGIAPRGEWRGRRPEGRRERGIAPRGEWRGRPPEGRRERGIAPRGEWRGDAGGRWPERGPAARGRRPDRGAVSGSGRGPASGRSTPGRPGRAGDRPRPHGGDASASGTSGHPGIERAGGSSSRGPRARRRPRP